MIGAAIIVAIALLIIAVGLVRLKGDFWLYVRAAAGVCVTSDGLKLLAFLGATGAGVVLTSYLAWNTAYLHARHRDDDVAYLAYGTLILVGITQLSLHRLLGAKQAIELEFWKLKASINQGDDGPVTPS